MRRSTLVVVLLVLTLFIVVDRPAPDAQTAAHIDRPAATHHLRHGYRNLDPSYAYPMAERAKRLFRRSFEGWPARGAPLDVVPNDGAELRANGVTPTITWVGHATFLIQLGGLNILTDPNWSDRASPVRFAGPKRLVPPGIQFADLPPIHAVVISHDHYDHLDEGTVRRLVAAHQPRFYVPLGIKPLLTAYGARDVVELDWWQTSTLGAVTFTAAPAQHSSGRWFRDQNERLWGSWAVSGRRHRLYFAGDTGYFAGFKEIGERLGPFDAALMPIGG